MARTPDTESETEMAVNVGDAVTAAGQTWTISEVDGDMLTVRGTDGSVRTALVGQIAHGVNP